MAIKKSKLYSSLWASCDELRDGMDASQYNDYVLTLIFVKYVSDKYWNKKDSLIEVSQGASFEDMIGLKVKSYIWEQINKMILRPLFAANGLEGSIELVDFDDDDKLGSGKEIVNAHIKAESQDWAGTVIDSSLIEEFASEEEERNFFNPFAVKYKVSYKEGVKQKTEEFALRLIKSSFKKKAYENTRADIERVFSQDNKSTSHPSVQLKIKSTIDFLKAFKE